MDIEKESSAIKENIAQLRGEIFETLAQSDADDPTIIMALISALACITQHIPHDVVCTMTQHTLDYYQNLVDKTDIHTGELQ